VDRLIDQLRAAGCVAAEEEARLLRAAAADDEELERLVRRREVGEPMAWITGSTEFGGVRVDVAAGVYVPRPQSVELARRAAALVPRDGMLVDVCAGSGAIGAWVRSRRPDATVVAVDLDEAAVRCASANGVPAVRADAAALPLRDGAADVVTAVAPYVPRDALAFLPSDVRRHEPRLALDGGREGLSVVRAVVRTSRRLLRPGGMLLLELGGDQDVRLADDLEGFAHREQWRDEEGDLRGLVVALDSGGEWGIAEDLHDGRVRIRRPGR
jgi:release factor glutamine methyltransferase